MIGSAGVVTAAAAQSHGPVALSPWSAWAMVALVAFAGVILIGVLVEELRGAWRARKRRG